MAIRTVITRGYGNGTYSGSIGLVTTRGYLGPGGPYPYVFLTVKPRTFSLTVRIRNKK